MEKLFNHIYNYSLLLTGLTAFWGAAIYRVYKLNNIGIIISLLLVIASTIIIVYYQRFYNNKKFELKPPASIAGEKAKIKTSDFVIILAFLSTIAFLLFTLFEFQTSSALISPWQVLPGYFFGLFALAAILLVANILSHNRYSLLFISLFYFVGFSVALIIFKIGFGFDSFVHSATINIIQDTGVVLPKPLYYLGQYSLIIIISKIFFIPVSFLNTFLVPLLAAIYLPWTFLLSLNNWFKNKTRINLVIVFLLIIPFSIFIITTPQNLAYLLLLLMAVLALKCKNHEDLILIYALSLAAVVTQPIAGIPALLMALLLTVYHSNVKNFRNNLYRLILLLGVTALPLAFYYVESQNSLAVSPQTGFSWPDFFSIPDNFVPNTESIILNTLYFYIFNLKFIFIGLASVGINIAYKFREHCRVLWLALAMSLATFLSYLITSLLPFNFLIFYERSNFADRLLIVSAIFLLPFVLLTIYSLINKLFNANIFVRYAWLAFLIILITISLYGSYPRFDNYYNSHSYATSRADVKAVNWIEDNTENEYIVLANQQVSAAALREYGFKKYYKSDNKIDNRQSTIFYYPIPTGGPLYQYYLDMVYESPSRETVSQAMDLTGVNEAYFVLNKYWWAFPKILEEAKLEADEFISIENGEVYVFMYKK